jgi:hypothetical protein
MAGPVRLALMKSFGRSTRFMTLIPAPVMASYFLVFGAEQMVRIGQGNGKYGKATTMIDR